MSNDHLVRSDNQNGKTRVSELGTKLVISTHAELKQLVKKAQK